METQAGELSTEMIEMLQAIWGEGFLLRADRRRCSRLIGAVDLRGRAVLDVGCGAGASPPSPRNTRRV
jgi:hypothetical protein